MHGYLYISQDIGNPSEFYPTPAALLCINKKERSQRLVNKAKGQEYFVKVFQEADDAYAFQKQKRTQRDRNDVIF